MNINKEQNVFIEQTCDLETTLLKIAWKTIWRTVHVEPINSEPIQDLIQVFFISWMHASAAFAL